MQPLATERNLRLIENASSMGGYRVMADNQRLRQVLINLLSNAIKYNREGGEVEIFCEPRPDSRLAIAVRDTGRGIAQEDLSKLFIPFERLGSSTSEIEGTGLGLSLAQHLVSAMGGTLNVESVVGTGTTFTVEFSQAAPEAALNTHEEHSARPAGYAYCVLCIEDNPSNLRLMETIFGSRPDIELITSIQGSIGLELALQHEPDLILLDLNLPDMHGSEVLSRLQQSAITQDIPVVIISADATTKQRDKLIAAGAKAYLTKPIVVELLLQTLDEILKVTTNVAN
ncbi:MAG: ATP-binding protein, partial [Abditibacteriaceae bacterium]